MTLRAAGKNTPAPRPSSRRAPTNCHSSVPMANQNSPTADSTRPPTSSNRAWPRSASPASSTPDTRAARNEAPEISPRPAAENPYRSWNSASRGKISPMPAPSAIDAARMGVVRATGGSVGPVDIGPSCQHRGTIPNAFGPNDCGDSGRPGVGMLVGT